jgi:hypothetical protein
MFLPVTSLRSVSISLELSLIHLVLYMPPIRRSRLHGGKGITHMTSGISVKYQYRLSD